jgi:hypothetical protein
MYNFKKSLMTLAGVLALLGVTAAVTPFTGYGQDGSNLETLAAQDVRVVNPTSAPVMTRITNPTGAPVPTRNVDGPRGNNIITLRCANATCKRVLSTGVLTNTEYVVPSGQVLVVTDMNWAGHCNSNCSTDAAQLIVGIGPTGAVHTSTLRFSGNGKGSASETMNTGFSVAAGKQLKFVIDFTDVNGALDYLFLHGYLIPAA